MDLAAEKFRFLLEDDEEESQKDLSSLTLSQKPMLVREDSFKQTMLSAAYNPQNETFFMLASNGVVECYNPDGSLNCIRQLQHPIENIVYNPSVGVFVGWSKGKSLINVIDGEMNEIGQNTHETPIQALASNQSEPEILLINSQTTLIRFAFGKSPGELLPIHVLYLDLNRITKVSMDDFIHYLIFSKRQKGLSYCCHGNGILEMDYLNEIVRFRPKLHAASLTACIEYNQETFITGCRDGTIKVWTRGWQCSHLFLGHAGAIIQMASLCDNHWLFSVGKDCTIRWWNTLSIAEIGKVSLPTSSLKGMAMNGDSTHFLMYSDNWGSWWHWKHISKIFLALKYPVRCLISVISPLSPPILFIGSIHDDFYIVNGDTGEILAEFLLEIDLSHTPFAASLTQEVMFIFNEKKKCIDKFTFSLELSTISRDSWIQRPGVVTCLTLYGPTQISQLLSWQEIQEEASTFKQRYPFTCNEDERQSTLLFVGHEDGNVSACDIIQGNILYKKKCHDSAVLLLQMNNSTNELLSIGEDKVARVWYVVTDPTLQFLPCRLIRLSFVSKLCANLTQHLAVVSNDSPEMAVYDLVNDVCYNQLKSQRHSATITGLTALETLDVFASTAKDITVRIWSTKNRVLRIIYIDKIPCETVFMSPKGNLALAMHKFVFTLSHNAYLPEDIICKRQVDGTINKEKVASPHNDNETSDADIESASMRSLSMEDIEEQRQFMLRLDERNQDILMIQNGVYNFSQLMKVGQEKKTSLE